MDNNFSLKQIVADSIISQIRTFANTVGSNVLILFNRQTWKKI